MKNVKIWKINVSMVYLTILFILGIFSLLFSTLNVHNNFFVMIGTMVGTLISFYFAIIIPVQSMHELKQWRKK